MKQKHDDYQVVPYTKIQRLLVPFLRSVQRTPTIHGLIEVDVTRARTFLRDHKANTGESLSFTAFLITVGGIGVKPGVVDGHIAIREYLSLTISLNHEMIDGAPAARFIRRLKDLIESGYGLNDFTVESEQAVAPGTSKKISSGSH